MYLAKGAWVSWVVHLADIRSYWMAVGVFEVKAFGIVGAAVNIYTFALKLCLD